MPGSTTHFSDLSSTIDPTNSLHNHPPYSFLFNTSKSYFSHIADVRQPRHTHIDFERIPLPGSTAHFSDLSPTNDEFIAESDNNRERTHHVRDNKNVRASRSLTTRPGRKRKPRANKLEAQSGHLIVQWASIGRVPVQRSRPGNPRGAFQLKRSCSVHANSSDGIGTDMRDSRKAAGVPSPPESRRPRNAGVLSRDTSSRGMSPPRAAHDNGAAAMAVRAVTHLPPERNRRLHAEVCSAVCVCAYVW